MLQIQTFDARAGGNVIYKALAHPLAAEAIVRLYARSTVRSRSTTPTASPMPCSRCTSRPVEALFVHDVGAVGEPRAGLTARPLTDRRQRRRHRADRRLRRRQHRRADRVHAAGRRDGPDAGRSRLPDALLTIRSRYLDG